MTRPSRTFMISVAACAIPGAVIAVIATLGAALADATLAAQDNPEESHYWRGLALQALGNYDEARREFETALAYNPNFEPARAALGN